MSCVLALTLKKNCSLLVVPTPHLFFFYIVRLHPDLNYSQSRRSHLVRGTEMPHPFLHVSPCPFLFKFSTVCREP
jgi:hypothetical protein